MKKIAEEHGARVRIANLRDDETDPDAPTRGAQVSLSFPRLAPGEGAASDRPAHTAPAH